MIGGNTRPEKALLAGNIFVPLKEKSRQKLSIAKVCILFQVQNGKFSAFLSVIF